MTYKQKLRLSDIFVNTGDRVLVTGTVVSSSITEATTFYSQLSKFNPNALQYGMTLSNPTVYSEQLKQQPPNPNVPTLKDFIESNYIYNREHDEQRYIIRNVKNEKFDNRPIVINRVNMEKVNLLGELASGQEVVLIINVYYSKQFNTYNLSFDGVVIRDIDEVRYIEKKENRVDVNSLGELPPLDGEHKEYQYEREQDMNRGYQQPNRQQSYQQPQNNRQQQQPTQQRQGYQPVHKERQTSYQQPYEKRQPSYQQRNNTQQQPQQSYASRQVDFANDGVRHKTPFDD